ANAADALIQLANQTADQLTLTSGSLGFQSQQAHALLSGFINPYGGVTGTVMAPTTTTAATLAAVNSQELSPGPFHVSFASPGRPGQFLSTLILAAPAGSFFIDDTFDVTHADLNTGGKVTGTVLADGTNLELDFTRGAFTLGDSLDYTIEVCRTGDFEGCRIGRPDLLLEGGTYTYDFETDGLRDGLLVPFEQFETTSDLLRLGDLLGGLFSDSQEPELRLPSHILNPDTFVGFGNLP